MNPGDRVRAERAGRGYEGVVLPSSTPEYVVLKLESGYNVGLDREATDWDVLESDVRDVEAAQVEEDEQGATEVEFDPELPTISLLSTGGTIASTVDYRTGAVTARFDAEDVLRAVPDLAGRANYRGRVVANILSENMTPEVWQELARCVHEEIEAGADGVVVMHGTDTMQFTASALAFALDAPVPIVFTGSQRSADRPSSDNVMNAVCAVEAAKSDCAEVLICMHASASDDVCALHRGTRARKNHTSRRDAFETVGREPLGYVDYAEASAAGVAADREASAAADSEVSDSEAVDSGDGAGADGTETASVAGQDVDVETVREASGVSFRREHAGRGDVELALHDDLEPAVELVKFTPGMDARLLEVAAEDAEGIVLEGTGLGHVSTELIPTIEAIVDAGTPVVMTSQCIEGRVCDRVYDTGRDLLDAGVIEGEDLLPGTAQVKLMWVLANRDERVEFGNGEVLVSGDDVETAMGEPLAGELTERSTPSR